MILKPIPFCAKAILAGALATSLYAGQAQAGLSCTFGALATCNNTENNVTFSGFSASGTGYDALDTITINYATPNRYTVSLNFNGAGNQLTGPASGNVSFTATAAPSYTFLNAQGNVDVVDPTVTVTNTLSNLIGGSFVSTGSLVGPINFNSSTTSTNVVISWSAASGSLANNSSLLIRTFQVPGPLPILGAATAFGFSRKLRRRIKSAA